MADQLVTKKEFLNLEKLVDRMVKEFDEEKKVVHDKLDALSKSHIDTQLQKSISDLKKWAENKFAGHEADIGEGRIALHNQLEYIRTWTSSQLEAISSQLEKINKTHGEAINQHAGEIKKLQNKVFN